MRLALRSIALMSLFALASTVVACGADVEGDPPSAFKPQPEPPKAPAEPDGEFQNADDSSLGTCAETSIAVKREQANVLLLIDRSGSMHIKLPNGDTRWQATKKGVDGLLAALPQTTQVGAMMFPQGDAPVNTHCGIDASINDVTCNAGWPVPAEAARCSAATYRPGVPANLLTSSQSAAIRNHVSSSDAEFFWGTPLAPALDAAITAQKSPNIKGARSVILLTDGNPTSCGNSGVSNDISYVVEAAKKGTGGELVRTFVIGVIDDARQSAKAENLSPVAAAGGTGRFAGCEATNECFYAVTAQNFATDIKKVFEQISAQAFDCTFPVPQPSGGATLDPATLNVEVTTANGSYVVPRDASKGDGWDYLPGGKQLQVYGNACKKLADDGAKLKVVVGCKTVIK